MGRRLNVGVIGVGTFGGLHAEVYRQMVGQILRFDPRYFTARERIKNGEIGQLVHLVAGGTTPVAVLGGYPDGGCESVGLVGDDVKYPELNYAPLVWDRRMGILRDELAHFADCVLNDREPLVSGQDGKAAVEVACAIQASYESGTAVQVP
jgi:predicted dehydrogenase